MLLALRISLRHHLQYADHKVVHAISQKHALAPIVLVLLMHVRVLATYAVRHQEFVTWMTCAMAYQLGVLMQDSPLASCAEVFPVRVMLRSSARETYCVLPMPISQAPKAVAQLQENVMLQNSALERGLPAQATPSFRGTLHVEILQGNVILQNCAAVLAPPAPKTPSLVLQQFVELKTAYVMLQKHVMAHRARVRMICCVRQDILAGPPLELVMQSIHAMAKLPIAMT
jgi:hypothetical protein